MNSRLVRFEEETEDEIIITEQLVISRGEYAGTYRMDEEIGASESGKVYRYVDVDSGSSKSCAVKLIYFHGEAEQKYEEYLMQCTAEQQLTAEMMGFCDSFVYQRSFFLVMPEIKPAGRLYKLFDEAKTDDDKLSLAIDALQVVDDMHKKNITHGDLSRNIMVNSATKKIHIIDFGHPSKKHDKYTAAMQNEIDSDKNDIVYYVFLSLKSRLSSKEKNQQIADLEQQSQLFSLSEVMMQLKKMMQVPKKEVAVSRKTSKLFDKDVKEAPKKMDKLKLRRNSAPK